LQRVLNAAARVVTGTRKCDRGLTQLLHTELRWLDVPERVKYKPRSVFQLLQWPPGNICVLPLVISWRYRLTASVRTVVGLLLSLAL